MISLIAAIDENYGLGKNNQLLCHLPADLIRFKQLTMGKPIIMGRNTFTSIGKVLPGRKNIVLSQYKLNITGVEVVNDLAAAVNLAAGYAQEIMIIGGANVFSQTMPFAHKLFITQIHNSFAADVFFPRFDLNSWHCKERITWLHDKKNQYDMTFYIYEKYPDLAE